MATATTTPRLESLRSAKLKEALTGYGFVQLGLNRISLGVFDFNPRARRAYEKAGFVAEGTEREALRHGDGWIDPTVMSVLAREWTVHRGHPRL